MGDSNHQIQILLVPTEIFSELKHCFFVCLFVWSDSGPIQLRRPARAPYPDGPPELLFQLHSVQTVRSGKIFVLSVWTENLSFFQCVLVCVCVCVCVCIFFTDVQSVRGSESG